MAHRAVHALTTAAVVTVIDAAPAGAAVIGELATTGRTIPFLAAGVAIGVALLLRAGASRLGDEETARNAADEVPADDDPGR